MQNFNLTFLQLELKRTGEWIQFSDKKTAFLSAFYSAIFGLVLSQKELILNHFKVDQKWELYFYIFIFLGFVIFFMLGVYFLLKSVFPELGNTHTNKSLFYFGNIANLKFTNYLDELKKLNEEDAKKQIIEQIYINSIIANRKMKNVQNSIEIFAIVVIFVLLLILL